MKHIIYLPIFFIILSLTGCSSGKKAFEKGNFYASTIQAVERLRKNPSHKKSRMVLEKAYPQAVQYHTNQVYQHRRANDRFKNETIVNQYKLLNNLYNEIQRCPACQEIITNPGSYSDEIRTYSSSAAEARYAAGIEALESGDRNQAREAFIHFETAGNYIRGYKDIETKMEEALELATVKVVVEQVPVPTVNYQLSVEFFQDQKGIYMKG